MDIEIIHDYEKPSFAGQGATSFKVDSINAFVCDRHDIVFLQHVLADIWIARPNEIGVKDIHTRTHLGHLLNAGDIVLGYFAIVDNTCDTFYWRFDCL